MTIMKTGYFWNVLASFQLSISIFMRLPGLILLFDLIYFNNRGSLLYYCPFTKFVQFSLYTFIFSILIPLEPKYSP